jgi:hypothetical protein
MVKEGRSRMAGEGRMEGRSREGIKEGRGREGRKEDGRKVKEAREAGRKEGR